MMKLKITSIAISSALLLLGFSSSAVAQNAPSTPIYAPKKSNLSAAHKLDILDVISRMNQAIDTNDYKVYADFYTAKGVIDSGFEPPVTGRAAIMASLVKSAPFITNKRHVASNVVINGSGQAATVVYYLVVFERQTGLTIAGTALITDELQRSSAGWQVARHTTRMDPATIKAMTAAMSGAAK